MHRAMTKRAGCGNPACFKTHWKLEEARACSLRVVETDARRENDALNRAPNPLKGIEPGVIWWEPHRRHPTDNMIDAMRYAQEAYRREIQGQFPEPTFSRPRSGPRDFALPPEARQKTYQHELETAAMQELIRRLVSGGISPAYIEQQVINTPEGQARYVPGVGWTVVPK